MSREFLAMEAEDQFRIKFGGRKKVSENDLGKDLNSPQYRSEQAGVLFSS